MRYPHLSRLARDILSISPASTLIERAWSSISGLIQSRQNRLSDVGLRHRAVVYINSRQSDYRSVMKEEARKELITLNAFEDGDDDDGDDDSDDEGLVEEEAQTDKEELVDIEDELVESSTIFKNIVEEHYISEEEEDDLDTIVVTGSENYPSLLEQARAMTVKIPTKPRGTLQNEEASEEEVSEGEEASEGEEDREGHQRRKRRKE